MVVTDIDFEKGHVDLSHRKIKPEDRDKHIKYFDYISKIYRLTEEFSKISKLAINDLLPLTMWQLINKDDIENSQQKFKAILERPVQFIDHAKTTYPSESNEFLDNMCARISSTTMTINQNFNLTAYCDNAINELKNILKFENMDNEIRIEYVNAPTYRFVVDCKFDDERNDLINKYIDIHQKKIKDKVCNQCDLVKLGNDIFIEEVDKYVRLIEKKIEGKKFHFELGDAFLTKEREITIKYLKKDEFVAKQQADLENSTESEEDNRETSNVDYIDDE
jgi:translation initiation factor 2 alpha subunit (eIF-2alpha)